VALITELRTAIAENLGTIVGLRTSPEMPDNPNPPIALVRPTTVDYNQAFNKGLTLYKFSVVVIVGRVAEKTAQRSLDAYCSSTGSSSIKNAVESDKTLGGKAYDCRVTEMTNYTPIQMNEGTYLAAEFAVDVFAD
jgi:hypothetical protein